MCVPRSYNLLVVKNISVVYHCASAYRATVL